MPWVTVRLEPCAVCQRDPAFGTIHLGCAQCTREKQWREQQPNLVRISREPLVFAEREAPMSIPELSQHQRDLIVMGICPFCERTIKGWKVPEGAYAPELWETLRQCKIDPVTGHQQDCAHKEIRL